MEFLRLRHSGAKVITTAGNSGMNLELGDNKI